MTTDGRQLAGTSLDGTEKISSLADTEFTSSTDEVSKYRLLRSSDDITTQGTTTVNDLFDLMPSKAIEDIKGTQTVDRLWGYRIDEFLNRRMRTFLQAIMFDTLQVERSNLVHSMETRSADLYRTHEVTEASTDIKQPSPDMESQILGYFQQLANEAADEVFEDGMESEFSQKLKPILETYGEIAIRAVERLIDQISSSVEVVGEILRHMGHMEDSSTRKIRLNLLIEHLESSDPRIRDAATLGLAALDDTQSIDALLEALNRESYTQLQTNYKIALDQLQKTKWQNS